MNKKGFSLIELLIAISVFGIGIITILNLILKNIFVVDGVKNKTVATMLAKESLEVVYNHRDTNLDKGLPWNAFSIDSSYHVDKYFEKGVDYVAGFNCKDSNLGTGGQLYFQEFDNSDSGKIFKHEINFLSYSGSCFDNDSDTAEITEFSRKINFSSVQYEHGNIDSSLLKITSSVTYGNNRSVVLESFIGDRN